MGFANFEAHTNLHDVQNDIIKTFKTKQVLGLVSLDIAKAFDTIPGDLT